MSEAIAECYDIFCTVLKIFGVYFALISVCFIFRKKSFPKAEKLMRFAVLIPARNEEKCIAGIVESLKNQNYPKELVDIFVIPNNCTDNTAYEAKKAGGLILPVPVWVYKKGDVLHEAFSILLSTESHDAYCVFDADNEASPDFIAEMNRVLQSGYRAAKSRILAKNAHESWVCSCYETYFCNANLFLNTARQNIGLSARLIGTGFAVRRDLMEELGGWNTETFTEDAEFYAALASRGEKVAYCAGAVTYDEEPLSFSESMTQRRRWMSGIIRVFRLKCKNLLSGLFSKKSFTTSFDALFQFSFAVLQGLIIPFFLVFAIFNPIKALVSLPVVFISFYAGAFLTGAAALILQRRLTVKTGLYLFTYPLFMLTFIPLQTLALFRPSYVWKQINHTGVRVQNAVSQTQ